MNKLIALIAVPILGSCTSGEIHGGFSSQRKLIPGGVALSEQAISLAGISPEGPLAAQGLAYGPYRDGQSPNEQRFPKLEEVREDLLQLRGVTRRLRTYGSSRWLQPIAQEAFRLGYSVMAGAWLGANREENQAEIAAVIEIANNGYSDVVIVGNEVLLRGDLTLTELLEQIASVRSSVPATTRVTTAEPWSVWLEHPELRDAVDLLVVHIYPFWEGKAVDEAVSYFKDKYQEVSAVSGDKPIIVGETGWPSAGTPNQAGVPDHVLPGASQQKKYLEGLATLATEHDITFYWFAAYDEEWKWDEGVGSGGIHSQEAPTNRSYSGSVPGSSWGILTSEGKLKPHLSELFPTLEQTSSRVTRVIHDSRGLAAMYDIGVDSSRRRRNWLRQTAEGIEMAYPSNQSWGAVFITIGEPTQPPRPWKDFSSFQTLSFDLRGDRGGESLEVGIKDAQDPDDGSEAKVRVASLPAEWKTYRVPLSDFGSANLSQLYVILELVFSGARAQTVHVRNIRYLP